ncbi:uncharacterized protein KD926_002670 [Aspergillus affinis]|uniref:uncharacterized protein n=1 Tax=Aspergillus affinis TaxID=1070780 RepID=UPI0022FEE7A8|nr:uncharacterized protein KD926_002670 [Aspergillus affinis]KAI9043780.1 hypothetical protein KD926_002670 [Aspergillus affinis]
MEQIIEPLCNRPMANPQELLVESLKGQSNLQQLEILTEIFTAGAVTDERFAETVYTAWEYLLQNDLWSFKYESLEQYRQLISYRDIIKPILQRFKRSDRSKLVNMQIIQENWSLQIHQVVPPSMAPASWSKHLLDLLAILSRTIKCKEQALDLLKKGIRERPRRSRLGSTLLASDVERVLRDLPLVNRARKSYSSGTYAGLNPSYGDPQLIDCRFFFAFPTALRDRTSSYPRSSWNNRSAQTPRSYSNDECETMSSIADSDCACAPICLPLRLVVRPHFSSLRDDLVIRLFKWAESIGWSSICDLHLRGLVSLRAGSEPERWTRNGMIAHLEGILLEPGVTEPAMALGYPSNLPGDFLETADPQLLLHSGSVPAWPEFLG